MFLRSMHRSPRQTARWLGTFRPELMLLEDRRAPGQTGLASAVTISLLGPALATWQLDELASTISVTGVAAGRDTAANLSSATATLSEPDTAAPSELIVTPSKETSADAVQTASAAATQMSNISNAVNLGAQAALDASRFVSINDPRVAVTTQLPSGMQRPGDPFRPSDEAGARNTVVGPNTLTHNLTQCNSSQGKMQSETAIAHSAGTVVTAYNDSRAFFCSGYQITGWGYSTDRGRTFTQGGLLPGTNRWGDPWLTSAPDGSIYLTDLRVTGGSLAGIKFTKGTPTGSGVNWATPVDFATSGVGPDKEAVTVDQNNGNIYISFTRFSGGSGIWSYRSTNGGASFTGPTVVTSSSATQGSVPAVGPNGEVYVAWQNNGGNYSIPTGIGFARSLDGGQSFTVIGNIAINTGTFISGTDRSPQFPHIAVDTSGGPNHGNIYIAYHSSHLGGGGNLHDALFVRSTDGGSTWSLPTKINDDGTSAAQWFPTINVDSAGFLHSFFYDRRGLSGTNTNLYYARSTDGGATWEPNVKVSSVSWNHSLTGNDGVTPYWGDYINADTQGKTAMVAYAEGRNGTPDTFFTRVANRD